MKALRSRDLFWFAIPMGIVASCYLAWHVMVPATFTLKEHVRTSDGDIATVVCQYRENVYWGLIHLAVEVDPGFINVDVMVKGRKLGLRSPKYYYLIAVHVYEGHCYIIMSSGPHVCLYTCSLDGGEFKEVPITSLPISLAYRNITQLGCSKDFNLSPEFVNSEEFLRTETANLWHSVATGQMLCYPMKREAFDRFKNEFLATRRKRVSP